MCFQGNVGSWGLVNMSGDSASSLKIFVVEVGDGDSGKHQVAVCKSRTEELCQIPAAMLNYVSSLHRLPSVVPGHFLYILLLQQEGVERTDFKFAVLDYHRNEWAELDVISPRAFPRIRLVGVQERLLLVGVREGIANVDDCYFIMTVFLSATAKCVEVCEMPGRFCAALADTGSVFKFKAVVRRHKASLYFMSSRGKPVVYSTTKNAWGYVAVLSSMHSDNYVAFEKPGRSRPQRVSGVEHTEGRGATGRPPRWRSCRQPERHEIVDGHEDETFNRHNPTTMRCAILEDPFHALLCSSRIY